MANYPAYQPMNPYGQTPQVGYSAGPLGSLQPVYSAYPQATPYTPPQPNPYSMNQPSAPASVRGRFITREEEIAPNEIAMDGQVSFFPLADYSCIIAKLWDSKGQIQTFKFVPLVDQPKEITVDNKDDMILGKLDDIESLLKHRVSHQPNKRNQNGSRNDEKEVNDA